MEKHRYVSTFFWDDTYIRKLDADGKLLFMYLLTNPRTQICGVYEIDIERMSFDTGLQQRKISDILTRFEHDEKVRYAANWIAMKNWIKHNSSSPQVALGIKRQLEKVPPALAAFVQGKEVPVDGTGGYGDGGSYLNRDRDRDQVSTPVAPTRVTEPKPKQIDFDFSDGKWVDITDRDIERWADAYPGISIDRELRKAAEWVIANPAKKKKNWRRFLVNWFERAQERGRG